MMRSLVVPAFALFALVACGDDSAFSDPAQVSLQPRESVLSPGQELAVDGVLRVRFDQVSEDSRCPIDAICVWQGNAAVEIDLTVGRGPTHPFTLNSSIEPREVEHAGYRVRLLEVGPAPVSTTSIEKRDYRVKVRVEKM